MYSSRKYPHPACGRSLRIPRETLGAFKSQVEILYEAKLEFPEWSGVVKIKQPSV